MVGGIRPVKDQLYLLEAFSAWRQKGHESLYLLVVGPVLHEEYAAKLRHTVSKCQGVKYIGGKTLAETHSLIRGSSALVNCSLSEGQATSILEAMTLRIPVLVRDIPANRALVTHGHTGLIYNSPEDFTHKLESLLGDESLRESVIENAAKYIFDIHNPSHEKRSYVNLVSKLVKGDPCK